MFYRYWTWLLQNLRFEKAWMSLCRKSQWEVARASSGLDGQDTRHLTRASFLSLTTRSPQEAANLENEKIRLTFQPNWHWRRSGHQIRPQKRWPKTIKKAAAKRPANHPSGGLKILRKCYNGLTNRHSVFDLMMIKKSRKTQNYDEKLWPLETRNWRNSLNCWSNSRSEG